MFIPTFGFHFPPMKSHFASLVGITAVSCVVITAASCSDRQKEPDPKVAQVANSKPSPAPNPAAEPALPPAGVTAVPVASSVVETPDIFADVSSTLDSVTKDEVAVLTPLPAKVNQSIDAMVSNWKAKGGNSTPINENKLSLARTDFAQKIQTLSLASADTWKTAKSDAQASLESLRRAYESLTSGADQS